MNIEHMIYDLRGNKQTSNHYYEVTYNLAQCVKVDLEQALGKYIRGYKVFVTLHKHESVRTSVEYGIELLVLGVLWRTYGGRANLLNDLPGYIATLTAKARRRSSYHKELFSKIKGRLTSKYLMPISSQRGQICELNKLILYLAASGEFEEEIIRFKGWQAFIQGQSFEQQRYFQRAVLLTASQFEKKVHKQLDRYTKGVEGFRQAYMQYGKDREDQIFCLKEPVQYHLNMVGAILLNEVYRKAYLRAKKHIIFLPQCMCIRKEGCLAKEQGESLKCSGCTKACEVNRVTQLAKRYSTETIILHHESELNQKKVKDEEGKIGIIGVCCVPNLIAGGFKAKRLGYVPQCVLLDYSGCKTHWDKQGKVTKINMDYLEFILGENKKNIFLNSI